MAVQALMTPDRPPQLGVVLITGAGLAAWRRAGNASRLTVERELRITPFVAVFVMRSTP